MKTTKYRIVQISPNRFEVQHTFLLGGGWGLVGTYLSKQAAQERIKLNIAAN